MKRIAVVGAGISGLATAWYLHHGLPDAEIEIFEANSRVGGVIQTLATPDVASSPYLIEGGADNFATLIPDAWELVQSMGLESEFISPKNDYRIAQVVHRGRLAPIPNGFSLMQPTRMGAILSTPILSVRGRMRVLGEYMVPRRMREEDESVEAFAVRRLGRECFERLVEPIVGGIFTANAATLSMQAAMPQFVAMERQFGGLIRAAFAKRKSQSAAQRSARQASGARYDQFTAPKRGMTWWLEKLAAPFSERLRLNTCVREMKRLPDHSWELDWEQTATGETGHGVYDAVVLAIPSYAASRLLQGIDTNLANELAAIPFASSAVAVLAVRKEEIRPEAFCFGSIAPSIERRECLAISLSSEKYAGRSPTDTVIARVFMGGALRPELLERSDEELINIAAHEVQQLFGTHSTPTYQSIVRWPRAMPQYLVGHAQRVARIRTLCSAYETLELTGNAYDGVGIPQCVRGAKEAALRVIGSPLISRALSTPQ